MRSPVAILAVLLVLVPPVPPARACPSLDLRLAQLVSMAEAIVVGEVIAVREAAGEKVVEVRVLDRLKGDDGVETFFYPARTVSWDDVDAPRVGERALLFLRSDAGYEATRAFWKALDRLRGGRPFLDLALGPLGRMRFDRPADRGEVLVRLYGLRLPPWVVAWLPEGASAETPQRMLYASALVEAVRELAATPERSADPSEPGEAEAPRDDEA